MMTGDHAQRLMKRNNETRDQLIRLLEQSVRTAPEGSRAKDASVDGSPPQTGVLTAAITRQEELEPFFVAAVTQARSSYLAAVSALFLGIAVILAGAGLFYVNPTLISEARLITGTGVVTEFIAAGFLALLGATGRRMDVYWDRLNDVQDTMFAIDLCNSLGPEEHCVVAKDMIGRLMREPARQPEPLWDKWFGKADAERKRQEERADRSGLRADGREAAPESLASE